MWKGVTDNKKAKRLSKEEMLLHSMAIDEVVEFDDLNKEVEETQDPEEAAYFLLAHHYPKCLFLSHHQILLL